MSLSWEGAEHTIRVRNPDRLLNAWVATPAQAGSAERHIGNTASCQSTAMEEEPSNG